MEVEDIFLIVILIVSVFCCIAIIAIGMGYKFSTDSHQPEQKLEPVTLRAKSTFLK